MRFEEKLEELVDYYLADEGYDALISALELKLMALREMAQDEEE